MDTQHEDIAVLQEAENCLRRLSPDRLWVVSDFLAYLEEKDAEEATAELLNIPGFEAAFSEALQQAEAEDVVPFERIRRHG